MVRSMYSGVSGLRTHQTRMDTIGNNIANVNTYGYKSSRATFRDIYYQTLSSAGGPTAAQGGTNPTQVGYGTQVGSIDLMMGRSTFSMTDQTMDLAIDGDGFFQVQDANGNTYYTRAGMLNFDAAGNLVDMQGNYVLGVNGDPTGRAPSSERITVSLPAVQPKPGEVVQEINGKEYTVTATNNTVDSNINFNFTSDSTLTDGVRAVAKLSSTGIIVTFNANESFANWGEVNAAINDAILAANGGVEHVGGQYNITYTGDPTKDPFLANNLPASGSLTGAELTSTDYGVQYGSAAFASSGPFFGGISPTGKVGATFSGEGTIDTFDAVYNSSAGAWEFTMMIGTDKYVGIVDSTRTNPSKFNLYKDGGDQNDYIEMNRPSFKTITDAYLATVPGSAGTKAEYNFDDTGLQADGTVVTISDTLTGSNVSVTLANDGSTTTYLDQLNQMVSAIRGNPAMSAIYDAKVDTSTTPESLLLTGKTAGARTGVTITGAFTNPVSANNGTNPITVPNNGDAFAQLTNAADLGGADAKATASGPSYALGLSGYALTLRGGTEGGPQTIADMTGIAIAGNGMIYGLDSQGEEVIIGRIDLATFPNQAGLTQAGSTTYMESLNSGVAQLTTPGTNGAGQLVGGTLELSNVDLSREFSDMITTQRGYQANSRIITVSDTMLEELINLKR